MVGSILFAWIQGYGDGIFFYSIILFENNGIALKVHADWLHKLCISFAAW